MNKEELEKIVYCLFTNGKYVYDAKEYTEILDNIFVAKWYDTIEDENGNVVYEKRQLTKKEEAYRNIDEGRRIEVIGLFNDINVKFYEMEDPTKTGTCSGYGTAILEDAEKIKSLLTAMINNVQPQLSNISEKLEIVFKGKAQDFIDEVRAYGHTGKGIRECFERWYNVHLKTNDKMKYDAYIKGVYNSVKEFHEDLARVPLDVKGYKSFMKV